MQDELMTANMDRYGEYLEYVYTRMARHVDPRNTVMEICTRHDRGVLSSKIIPHSHFYLIDKDPKRPGKNLNAIIDELPFCDILISTAILHHTSPCDIPALFRNLGKNTKGMMLFTGPNIETVPELYGDHLYHLDKEKLIHLGRVCGWICTVAEPIGITEPFCELFLAFVKNP